MERRLENSITPMPEEDVYTEMIEEEISQGYAELTGILIGHELDLTPEQRELNRKELTSDSYLGGNFPEKYREVLVFRHGLEGERKTMRSIAKTLDLNIEAVKSRVASAEMRLRAKAIRNDLKGKVGITENNYVFSEENT